MFLSSAHIRHVGIVDNKELRITKRLFFLKAWDLNDFQSNWFIEACISIKRKDTHKYVASRAQITETVTFIISTSHAKN